MEDTLKKRISEDFDSACKKRFDEEQFPPFLKTNCHFWVDNVKQRALFGLTFNNRKDYQCRYKYLGNLTAEQFSSMVEVLLRFQQQPRVGMYPEGKPSILNYHFGWKTQPLFHLKILPHSLEDFRSTFLHYLPDEQCAKTLMSNPLLKTEYEQYEKKLKFVKENIDKSDTVHALVGRHCTFYISRSTYSIVAVNSIDVSTCEHPYYEAYHYARMLETYFTKDVVGGVSFGVDHSEKKVWVWADCDEDQFETKVLSPHNVVKTGEFQKYCKTDTPVEPKPEGCKAVHMDRISGHVDESDVEQFFSKCGKIEDIHLFRSAAVMIVDVHFADTTAVDKAMELGDELFKGSKIRLAYFLSKEQRAL